MSISKPPFGIKPNYAHPLMRGLIGWWLFNEGAGGQAYDSSLNRNTGTLTGMAFPSTAASGWGSGRNGAKGLSFDGVDDKITTTSEFIGTGPITFSGWVYARSFGGNSAGRIISNGRFDIYITGANRIYFTSNAGTNIYATPTNSFPFNQWIHIIATRDSSGISNVYFNGILSGTANQSSGAPVAGTFNPVIGNHNSLNRTWDGYIDDARIYNRALSAQEVQNLYTDPYGMFNSSKLVLSDLIGAPAVANGGFFQFM